MLFKERGVSLPENLLPVHQLLNADSDAGKDWKRQDIWRILAATYAILLRTTQSVKTSPRLSKKTIEMEGAGALVPRMTSRAPGGPA